MTVTGPGRAYSHILKLVFRSGVETTVVVTEKVARDVLQAVRQSALTGNVNVVCEFEALLVNGRTPTQWLVRLADVSAVRVFRDEGL